MANIVNLLLPTNRKSHVGIPFTYLYLTLAYVDLTLGHSKVKVGVIHISNMVRDGTNITFAIKHDVKMWAFD